MEKVALTRNSKLNQLDLTRQSLNLVFIGHVDAGKSTLSGRILVETG